VKLRLAALGVVVAAMVVWLWPREEPRFTAEELLAIEAAWAAVTEHNVIQDRSIVEVEREGDVYFVTWPLPPGPPRPTGDFQARVRVHAGTYEVIAIALGS
jgi:hypothetical protein